MDKYAMLDSVIILFKIFVKKFDNSRKINK